MDMTVPYACITLSSYRVITGTASRGPCLTNPHFTAFCNEQEKNLDRYRLLKIFIINIKQTGRKLNKHLTIIYSYNNV